MLNYLTDAYKQNSASAQAAASTIRSIMAFCLPLAANPMYSNLGIHWASTLLGFIALCMAVIPLILSDMGAGSGRIVGIVGKWWKMRQGRMRESKGLLGE